MNTSTSTEPCPDLTDSLLHQGGDLAVAVIDWPYWCHRKIDSVNLLEGGRGRRRISLDCTPLAVCSSDTLSSSIAHDNNEPTIVPITYMGKETLQDFDLHDSSGASLPVLGREDNARLAAAAVAYLFHILDGVDGTNFDIELWERIYRVAVSPSQEAAELAARLIEENNLDAISATLLRDISTNFLLMTQLPSSAVGERQVLKYSYHWESRLPTVRRPVRRAFWAAIAGIGWGTFKLRISLDSIDSVKSYHLECLAPKGLVSTEMTLPNDISGKERSDRSHSTIGHINGNYARSSVTSQEARIGFALDSAQLLPRVLVSAIAVGVLFAALLAVPGAYDALTTSIDAATALFLFVPAVLVAANARGDENALTSRLLSPLRRIAGLLALLLFGAGGMLVLQIQQAIVFMYWWASLGMAAMIAVVLSVGYVILKVRGGK